jgi:membrane-bound lytic murein transglycosylase A
LAVDRRFISLGTFVWLKTNYTDENGQKLQRLMVAQDTGGAIKGMIRGDVFWGSGATALKLAGPMKAQGELFLIIPKSIEVVGVL